jgi:hypothetical protein
MELSIIIVNWKSVDFTRKCLASIAANAGNLKYEVIVIDNASWDGCGEMIQEEFPHILFIQSNRNLGFAGANNLAFAKAVGRNVMFLNPDTEIQGLALQTLVSALESHPDAGMVGARLLNSDHTLQTHCVVALPSILNHTLNSDFLRKTFPKWSIWGTRPLFEPHTRPVPVEAITGACMLLKRRVNEQVHGFSTNYFMYSEDMDLCIKVAKAGWKIYYVPTAMIVHHAGGSSGSREESNFSTLMVRESLTQFMKAHRGHAYATLFRLCTGVAALLRVLVLLAVSPIAMHPAGCRLICRALNKWWGVLTWSIGAKAWVSHQSKRQTLQNQSAVTYEYDTQKASVQQV